MEETGTDYQTVYCTGGCGYSWVLPPHATAGQNPVCSTCYDASRVGFRADVQESYIAMFDGDQELVYWDEAEWMEDPSLAVNIANAVHIGYTQGAHAVRNIIESRATA